MTVFIRIGLHIQQPTVQYTTFYAFSQYNYNKINRKLYTKDGCKKFDYYYNKAVKLLKALNTRSMSGQAATAITANFVKEINSVSTIKEIEFRFKEQNVLAEEFDGIILIDEVEIHLHPEWQEKIISILRETFPCAQFIVTTHSPHVIQTAEPNQVIALQLQDDNDISNTYRP